MQCPNPDCVDVKRTGIPGEYRDGTTLCAKCGTSLVPKSEPVPESQEKFKAEPIPTGLVPCYVFHDAALIPHAKALLKSSNIDYVTNNEAVQNLIGWGTLGAGYNVVVGAPTLMVSPADVERAQELLSQLETAIHSQPTTETRLHSANPQSATCPHCNGAIEFQQEEEALTDCYHCGSPLHAD